MNIYLLNMHINQFLFFIILFIKSSSSLVSMSADAGESQGELIATRINIVFYGLPGSEKLSTIKQLLNASVALPGCSVNDSCTHWSKILTTEYSVEISQESEIRLIDTPEIPDSTNGPEKVAKYFVALEKYFSHSHEELNNLSPDIIVICLRAEDLQMIDNQGLSNFEYVLRGVSVLQNLFPTNNVILLITKSDLSDDDEKYKNEIIKSIKNHSLLSPPFHVVIANTQLGNQTDFTDQESPDSGIYSICESMKKILAISSNDVNKIKVLSSLCSDDPTISRNAKLVSQVPLLMQSRNSRFQKMLEVIQLKSGISDISTRLSEINNSASPSDRVSNDSIIYLQNFLSFQLITTISDIPKTDMDVAVAFRNFERSDNATLQLLEKAFGLVPPTLQINLLVGNSYDILQDNAMAISPLKINGKLQFNEVIGCMVIANRKMKMGFQTKIYYENFPSKIEYLKKRALLLGVDEKLLLKNHRESNFAPNLKPGFNVISGDNCSSLFVEWRLFSSQIQNFTFNSGFISKLHDLNRLDTAAPKIVHSWTRFLKTYGTYIVTESYLGGSIEFLFQNYNFAFSDKREILEIIKGRNTTALEALETKVALKIVGGDPIFYSENPRLFFKGGKTSLFEFWQASLSKQPAVLSNFVKIKSLVEILNAAEYNLLSDKLSEAIEFFSNDEKLENVILKAESLQQENWKLSSDLNLVNDEKSTCYTTKSNLSNKVEQTRGLKNEVEKQYSKITLELEESTQNLSMTKNNFENAIIRTVILRTDLDNCKSNSDAVKNELAAETSAINNLKQTLAASQTNMGSLQTAELQLRAELTKCNTLQCNACGGPKSKAIPLHRYYNSRNGDHFYTTNWNELGGGRGHYRYEGVQARIFPSAETGTVPLHRYYNRRNGDHFYTTNWAELEGGRGGYTHEGTAGYLYSTEVVGSVPLYRYYNGGNGDHFYTTNFGELGGGRGGYGREGNAGYICP